MPRRGTRISFEFRILKGAQQQAEEKQDIAAVAAIAKYAGTLMNAHDFTTPIKAELCEKLADVQPAQPTIATFTILEEGGCHGAKNLCARERPTVFLAVDGAPVFPDGDLDLDGLCVWSKNAKVHCDQRLAKAVLEAGRWCGHRVQPAVMPIAYSDATAVYDTGFAPRVATFGHIGENSHGFEVARLGSWRRYGCACRPDHEGSVNEQRKQVIRRQQAIRRGRHGRAGSDVY